MRSDYLEKRKPECLGRTNEKTPNFREWYWLFKCPYCSNTFRAIKWNVTSGATCSCGCYLARRQDHITTVNGHPKPKRIERTSLQNRNGEYYYIFRCPYCDRPFTTTLASVNNGGTRSCGCLMGQGMIGRRANNWINLADEIVKDLYVVRDMGTTGKKSLWLCLCLGCGNERTLTYGRIMNVGHCGCLRASRQSESLRLINLRRFLNFAASLQERLNGNPHA
jgi:uncharacterized C2H2 Zn-finger protein